MSKQDARKVSLIEELLSRRISNSQAASLLDLSVRQVQRLKVTASTNGVISLLHKSRGRKPANTLDPGISAQLVKIYNSDLLNYNFCHATDILSEEKGISVSVSTVSRYLKAAGISSPKAKRRPKHHRSRNPRAREGELVQMDASCFDWLGNGSYLHLHGAIDDATGKVLALYFDKEETSAAYCELMFQMNNDGHLPRELYTDGRTCFAYDSKTKKHLSIADELAGMTERMPQFARALKEINVRLIIAKSPQAKGCIERLWETLQDRLAKDLQRNNITTVDQANTFLVQYISYYNQKFAVLALNPDVAYLPKLPSASMQLIFARHETRKLNSGLAFSFNNVKYRLPSLHNSEIVPASPHDTITVITSKYVGIQVLFNGLVLSPEQLLTRPKSSIARVDLKAKQIHVSSKLNNNSPWFGFTKMFFSNALTTAPRRDISPD